MHIDGLSMGYTLLCLAVERQNKDVCFLLKLKGSNSRETLQIERNQYYLLVKIVTF